LEKLPSTPKLQLPGRKIIVDIMPKESHNRLVKPDLYVQSDALLFIRELSKISQAEKICADMAECPKKSTKKFWKNWRISRYK
jgi:hypothetical protein